MYTIQIGSFVLNGQILMLFIFGCFGWAAMRSYVRKGHAENVFSEIAFNAFVIWFLVWKGSPLILDPMQTIQHPASLLYFDGGARGQMIASLIAGLYMAYRAWKGNMSWKMTAEAATVFLLGGAAAFHTGFIWLDGDNWPFHAGYGVLASITLLTFIRSKQSISLKDILHRWQWFSIGLVFIWFLHPDRVLWVLSFSFQQAVSLIAGVLLSVYLWLCHGKQTNGQRGSY